MTASPKGQARNELFGRYGEVFRHAWAERKRLDGEARTPLEAQFLPAALALRDTPLSPAPRVAMWLIVAFAALALLWAIFGRIDVVATAQGRIVPNDRIKTIQPMETAVVQAIHVSDGQAVKAGDVLVELDATDARADEERLVGELAQARLQAARGEAMLIALERGRQPLLPEVEEAGPIRLAEAERQVLGQFAEYTARMARLDAEIARRESERRATVELVRKLEQTAPIVRRRAEDAKSLLGQHYVARHDYLELEQASIEQESDLAAQREKLHEIEGGLRAAREEKKALAAETRRSTLDSIQEATQKVIGLEQELVKARTRHRLMRLVAPVEGTVQQLAVHTVGGVVTPAQPLMVIVPRDHPLEIEAFVENKDIGFVRQGQEAEVKIETFLYTKYGVIPATVLSVSHDAINDEKRGLVYTARVKMARASLAVDGTEVRLGPGMAVSVEIKTGRRRVIEYFLSPLLQYGHESLRER
ncbi:MAG: HlyD family type I secretion periplasmic adaptor subunit [Pseudomonadota bacterium]